MDYLTLKGLIEGLNILNIGLTVILSSIIILSTYWALRRRWWETKLQPFIVQMKDHEKYVEVRLNSMEEINTQNEKRYEETMVEIKDMFHKTQKAVANQANSCVLHMAKSESDKELLGLKEKAVEEWRIKFEKDLTEVKDNMTSMRSEFNNNLNALRTEVLRGKNTNGSSSRT